MVRSDNHPGDVWYDKPHPPYDAADADRGCRDYRRPDDDDNAELAGVYPHGLCFLLPEREHVYSPSDEEQRYGAPHYDGADDEKIV